VGPIRCVITNDDGIDAPGLRALYAALRELADVTVVAPSLEWSTRGHNAPSRDPIHVEHRDDPEMGRVFVVHAQPADCVRLALAELVRPAPDAVIAGINRGGNVGVDLFYSGTVAAAREAAILGCPAIAISQLVRKDMPVDWGVATARARRLLRHLLAALRDDRPARLWNVNLPHLPPGGRPKGVIKAPMATSPLQIRYEQLDAPPPSGGERSVYRYAGAYFQRPQPPGTDLEYLFADWATITELTNDLTNASTDRAELSWTLD
jgi:5'/3'-nucleotidase